MPLVTGLSVIMAAVALIMDLQKGSVDNGWILFGYLCGLAVRMFTGGMHGMLIFFPGTLLPLLLLGWLFVFRMLGAGDIKLISVLGGLMGAQKILKCIAWTVVIGAGISAAILISTGLAGQRFQYFWNYLCSLKTAGSKRLPYRRKGVDLPENFHFTVPIFLSVLLYAGGVY